MLVQKRPSFAADLKAAMETLHSINYFEPHSQLYALPRMCAICHCEAHSLETEPGNSIHDTEPKNWQFIVPYCELN